MRTIGECGVWLLPLILLGDPISLSSVLSGKENWDTEMMMNNVLKMYYFK